MDNRIRAMLSGDLKAWGKTTFDVLPFFFGGESASVGELLAAQRAARLDSTLARTLPEDHVWTSAIEAAKEAPEFKLAGKPNGGKARITVNKDTGVGLVNFIDPAGIDPTGHNVSAFNHEIVANNLPRGTLIGMAHGDPALNGNLAPGINTRRFLRGMDKAAQVMKDEGIPVRFCVGMVCGGGRGNLLHHINTYFSPELGTGGFTGAMTNRVRGVVDPETGLTSIMIYLPPNH